MELITTLMDDKRAQLAAFFITCVLAILILELKFPNRRKKS